VFISKPKLFGVFGFYQCWAGFYFYEEPPVPVLIRVRNINGTENPILVQFFFGKKKKKNPNQTKPNSGSGSKNSTQFQGTQTRTHFRPSSSPVAVKPD
jgi:hypothetical protein